LANKRSAIKRLRSARRRYLHNRTYRGGARTAVKRARFLIEEGNLPEAREAVHEAISTLDKAAAKGIIHKNNAARRKSRLMQALNEAERAV
jgi:small subunit ribosomal protein S20